LVRIMASKSSRDAYTDMLLALVEGTQ